MNYPIILTMARMEIRLRMRRLGTIITSLVVCCLTWASIVDPETGRAMIVINGARVLHTSSVFALVSAVNASMLFGLVGFYLLRGRMGEDIRSGIGSVIASTHVRNGQFLFARWLGGIGYLASLVFVVMLTTMLRDLLQGSATIEPLIYLSSYALIFIPFLFFSTSCALLFDSVKWLMGKTGDVVYFLVWVTMFASVTFLTLPNSRILIDAPWLLNFDFFGVNSAMLIIKNIFGTDQFNFGGARFNAALTPLQFPSSIWYSSLVFQRMVAAAIALIPAIPAVLLFHRYSPDRIKASAGNTRRSPISLLNQLLRPVARLAQPLFRLANHVPGFAGQVIAELAISLISSPIAILALFILPTASLIAPAENLVLIAMIAVLIWMVFISDISTRDYQADSEAMSGAIASGTTGRFTRQFAVTYLSGLLMMGIIVLRWVPTHLLSAAAMLSGLLMLTAIATALGRCSRSAHGFIMLSMLWLYIASQANKMPWLDLIGFNHEATLTTIITFSITSVILTGLAYCYHRYQAR